jgi:WD40 repeat protein
MRRNLYYGALLALVMGCAAYGGFDLPADFKSDIRPVIQLGHSGAVNTVAISPNDRFTVSGSADGTLKFWEVSTGRLIYTSYHHLNESSVSAFEGSEVEYQRITLRPQINCVDISANGRLLLSGSSDGNVIVTEIRTGNLIHVYRQHNKSVNAAAFSKGANLAVTGDAQGIIRVWQISAGRTIHKFHIKFRTSQITVLDFSPDGRMILAGDSEGIIRLIDLGAERRIQILGHHSSPVSAAKFSTDGRMAVSGSRDGSVKLWRINPRGEMSSLKGRNKNVIAVGFNRSGDRILSCAADGTVRIWNAGSMLIRTTRITHLAEIYTAVFSTDERFIITGGRDRTLKRSWLKTGCAINTFEGRSSRIHSVVFSPDGRLLLSAMRGQVNCWDMTTGRLRQIFKAKLYKDDPENIFKDQHPQSMQLSSVGFSPDGSQVVSLGIDGTYHAWRLATGNKIKTPERYATKLSTVAYSPDKRYSARGTRIIRVRDTENGRVIRRLDGHKKWVTAIAYSPDGRSILSGDAGGNLILWNVMMGIAVKRFSGHSAAVTSIDFSKAGRFVATGSWDNSCRIWDVASGQEIVKHIASPDGEWITSSPDGFYINSPEGHNLIHWSVPGDLETYSFEQFESEFKRPDMIAARLSWDHEISLISSDIAKPPRISITGQNEVITISEKQYPLQVTTSGAETIETLRVFLNGKPIHEVGATPNQSSFSLLVPLVFGVNRITAVAYDKRGFSSNPKFIDVISKNPELQRPNLHVYAIGVSRYARMQAEWQLQYAHTDAKAIITAFKSQEGKMFGSVSSTLLVNEQATADAILENLCAFKKAGEVDISIIFMAGHGVKTSDGDYYFLGYNGEFNNPQSDGLNWERLKKCLSHAKGRATLFLDACHSGSIVNETVVPNDEMAHQFFTGERAGVMVFTASKGRQSALESPDIGGGFGLFTWALTQGIGSRAVEADVNGNKVIEFMELVNFVERYVGEITDGAQTPWLSRKELFGDLPIAIVE